MAAYYCNLNMLEERLDCYEKSRAEFYKILPEDNGWIQMVDKWISTAKTDLNRTKMRKSQS